MISVICNLVPLYVKCPHLLGSFQDFPLFLNFLKFEYNMPRGGFLSVYLFSVSKLSGPEVCCLSLILEISQPLLLQIFLWLLFHSLFLWYCHYAHVTSSVIVPQYFYTLFFLTFFHFSLYLQFGKFLWIYLQGH